MSLEEAIDHAVAKADELAEAIARAGGDIPDLEQCELEHRQLVQWLTELHGLRFRVRQLAGDLDTTRTKLRDLQRDVGKPLDEHVHVTVTISTMNEGIRHAGRISPETWRHPPVNDPGYPDALEWRARILRETIESVAYEAAFGFFADTKR